jgi:hypothetical protein
MLVGGEVQLLDALILEEWVQKFIDLPLFGFRE